MPPRNMDQVITWREMNEHVKDIAQGLHSQFIEGMQIEHENKLAAEVREVYCKVNRLRRGEAAMAAQFNGLLAARILELKECAKVQGFGQVLALQQCRPLRVEIQAIETDKCGFQPIFLINGQNYTIGLDGWSMHVFTPCFWPAHFINVNGQAYAYEHPTDNKTTGDWKLQVPQIHAPNVDLLKKFDEVILNDYDLRVQAHPAQAVNELEQLNVMAELMGRITESDGSSLSSVTLSQNHLSQMNWLNIWFPITKIIVSVLVGIVGCGGLYLACRRFIPNPLAAISNLRSRINSRRKPEDIELEIRNPSGRPAAVPLLPSVGRRPSDETRGTPSAPSVSQFHHSHTTASYATGKGLVWEDMCPCLPPEA